MNISYNIDDVIIPDYTVIIRLAPKEQVTEENGLYLLSNTIQLRLENGQIIHVPDPNVFMPFGEVIKTGPKSNLKPGYIGYIADEVATVKLNIDENNPYPHVMPYGFWLDPAMKYRIQTDLVHIPETLINAWVKR
mgnify:CR=1 FL=1